MEAKEASGVADVLLEHLLEVPPDDCLHSWTRVLVEAPGQTFR